MSTEDKPEKPREDDFRETPEWHRARAKHLRKNGFTKMAQEHEQIALMIVAHVAFYVVEHVLRLSDVAQAAGVRDGVAQRL